MGVSGRLDGEFFEGGDEGLLRSGDRLMVRIEHVGRTFEQATRAIIASKLGCFAFGLAGDGED